MVEVEHEGPPGFRLPAQQPIALVIEQHCVPKAAFHGTFDSVEQRGGRVTQHQYTAFLIAAVVHWGGNSQQGLAGEQYLPVFGGKDQS